MQESAGKEESGDQGSNWSKPESKQRLMECMGNPDALKPGGHPGDGAAKKKPGKTSMDESIRGQTHGEECFR
jgi:hypothetical protein